MINIITQQVTTGVVAVVRPWEVQVSITAAARTTATTAMRPATAGLPASGHLTTRTLAPTYTSMNGTDLPVALGSTFRSPPV